MVSSGFRLLSHTLTFKGKNCWAGCCLEVQLMFLRAPLGPCLCSRCTWGRWCFARIDTVSQMLSSGTGLVGFKCSVAVGAGVKLGRERRAQRTCVQQGSPGR